MRKPVTPRKWKQPDEVRRVTFDFTSKLNGGDTVATIVGNALVTPAGITAGAPTLSVNTVTALLSGGTDGETYRVECRVTTAQGETLELDLDLEVLDGAN